MTKEIAATIQKSLQQRGVGVICYAATSAMMVRESKAALGTSISVMLGAFRSRKATRGEFLSVVQ